MNHLIVYVVAHYLAETLLHSFWYMIALLLEILYP